MTAARVSALSFAVAMLAALPALAAENNDAPVTPPSVGEQIDAYLKSSPALALPSEAASDVTSSENLRKVHGEFSAAIGTGGYRSAYVRSDFPVGRTGTLSIALENTQSNGRRGGYGYGDPYGRAAGGRQNLGIGLSLGDVGAAIGLRCRSLRDPDRPYADTPDRRACLQGRDGAPLSMR